MVIYDAMRHMAVYPYTLAALHEAAESLGIKRCWFHKDHYDLPKRFTPTPDMVEVHPVTMLFVVRKKLHKMSIVKRDLDFLQGKMR